MLLLITILVFVGTLHGFLLDNNNTLNSGSHTGESQHYISKSELLDTKAQLHTEINFLRNDMDEKLVLLTSQLQQMLASLKQQITENSSRNETTKSDELERKLGELMKNNSKLQDKLDLMQIKYTKQEIELQSLKNETKEHGVEIGNLNSLKTVNQLTDFHSLQQEVQSVSAQTHSLAVNDLARTQDFQALYNLTVMSLVDVHQQIAQIHERVALTACADASEYNNSPYASGHIIKYGDIRTQVNINNINSFRSIGKFTCEKEGLYLVSAWATSYSTKSEFAIYKNGNDIAQAFITGSSDYYYTATAVVAVELRPSDTVWVQVFYTMTVGYPQRSCLTIVKIK